MGFRYHRRIKILPGVHVNFSKKGFSSISIGERGATANISKRGVKDTFGLPGTGLSYQTKTTPLHQRSSTHGFVCLLLLVAGAVIVWWLTH
jgi:hypothetical protein